MANVTVVTSNPVVTVDSTTNTINVGTTQANVVVGATVPGTLANTIATSGRFSTLSVGNASTVQYTFPTADGTANQILKTDGNGVLTFVQDDGAVDSVNGLTGNVVLTTTEIAEGTNEYFTQSRARGSISATSPVLYNNTSGVISIDGSALFTGKTTDDLTEGSTNLYFTDGRADSRVNLQTGTNLDLSNKNTGDLSEGSNLYFTNTRADDRVNLQTGTNLDLSSKSTTDVAEGTNLYYTDARVDSRLSSGSISTGIKTTNAVFTNTINPISGTTVTIDGNMEVNGNLNVVEKVDLLVQDNKIVLNYGNATARDAFITVDRSGSSLTNASIQWNETSDKFTTTNSFDVTGTVSGTTVSDGTGSITGGVGTGFSSITSTALVGDLTGAVTGDTTGTHTGAVTGDVTGNLTGDVTGNLTGDSTGTHTGAVTGDVTGNLTGDVTGAVTGDVTGNLTGDVTGNTTGDVNTDLIQPDAGVVSKISGGGISGIQTGLVGSADPWRTGASANEQNWGQLSFAGHSFRSSNSPVYAGTSAIPTTFGFNTIVTAGSPTVEIHGVEQAAGYIGGNNAFGYSTNQTDIDNALNGIGIGSVVTGSDLEKVGSAGDTGFDQPLAPAVLTVVSIDLTVTPRTVTLSQNAARNSANDQVPNVNGKSLSIGPGFYSTTTGFTSAILNGVDATDGTTGATTSDIGYVGSITRDIFGHTQYALPSSFSTASAAADGSVLDLSQFSATGNFPFFEGTSKMVYTADATQTTYGGTLPSPAVNSPHNITIGPETNTGNRAFNDTFRAFGLTTGYNGKLDTATFSRPPVVHNQIFQHVDNSAMTNNSYFRDVAGPRLFLALADGNTDTPLNQQYAKPGDEIGRLQGWARSENVASPSTYYANHKLAFYASDFTGSNTAGEVTIATTHPNTGIKSVFGTDNGQIQQGGLMTYVNGAEVHTKSDSDYSNRYRSGLGVSKKSITISEKIDSANEGSGSQFSVCHGAESRPDIIGDLKLGIHRGLRGSKDWVMKVDRGTFTSNSGGTTNNQNWYPYFYLSNISDGIRFNSTNKYNSIPEDFVDGMEIQLDGFSGAFGTAVNGNTYYGRLAFGIIMTLYNDAALTQPERTLSNTIAFGTDIDTEKTGTIRILQSNFANQQTLDDQAYYWKLAQSDDRLQLVDKRFGTDYEVFNYDPFDRSVPTAGKFTFLRDVESANTITSGGFVGDIIGDLNGAVTQKVKNITGSTLTKGMAVVLTGAHTGDIPHIDFTENDDAALMPAIGLVKENIPDNEEGVVVTSGEMNFQGHGFTPGDDLYIAPANGSLTATKPTGESQFIQKIGKAISPNHVLVQGAFRTNDTPNLNNGNIFIGDSNEQAVTATLDTSIVPENTNLYYTTARANTDFDSRLFLKSTDDLAEGNNLYYTDTRVDSRLSGGSLPTVNANNTILKQFNETKVVLGNKSGDISSDLNAQNGSIFTLTATGDITINSFLNPNVGASFTVIIQQDSNGSRLLTAGSNIKWAGGVKTLTTTANATDIISVIYDGSTYWASLGRGYV